MVRKDDLTCHAEFDNTKLQYIIKTLMSACMSHSVEKKNYETDFNMVKTT